MIETWREVVIMDGWLGKRLLADICMETRLPAPDVMATVRRLKLPDRHPTTRQIDPPFVVSLDAPPAMPPA